MSFFSHSRRASAFAVALAAGSVVFVAPTAFAAPDGSNIVINELYGGGGNSGSVFNNDFVELYNPTAEPIDITGWTLTQLSAAGNVGNRAPLSGIVPANSYFLIQGAPGNNTPAPLPTPDFEAPTLGYSATNASAELLDESGATVDLVGTGSATRFEGSAATPAMSNATSVERTTVGVDTDDNAADFSVANPPTPQNSTGDEPVDPDPEEPVDPVDPVDPAEITPIAEIQGTGPATPLEGQTVTTTGVVTGVYDQGGRNGYYIQTAGTGGAVQNVGDASDGIFVYAGSGASYPAIGDSVQVTGTATEYFEVTQISNSQMEILSEPLDPITPVEIDTLPAGDDAREPYESMLVLPTGDYTVTNNYALNTFGEVGLAPGTEAFRQPTDVVLPGAEANALQAEIDEQLVTLDDGRTPNYMNSDKSTPLPYIATEGTTNKSLRTGDGVDFQHPVVVHFSHNSWRFQPTTPITGNNTAAELPISWEDSRAAELGVPAAVQGEYSVATFNVLNYFTSLGEDEPGCRAYNDMYGNPVATDYCNVRGAYSTDAFNDQQIKIINAINQLDADVIALEEIENTATVTGDVTRRDESVAHLVEVLNISAGSNKWDYVESPIELGTDEDYIRTAFIFQPAQVEVVGESRIFDDPVFTGVARQPLAQEFQPAGGGESFVAIANHFKSKGSVANGDADMGDGQGNNANLRTEQATALIEHLNQQDDWADLPVFVLGDLNAYSQEDAVRRFEQEGFTNINESHAGSTPTYQFSGLLGSLDHALGNEAAMDNVVDAAVWNINADESIAYEYSRRNYNTVDFHDESPFRSSDHDPIKVGFTLGDQGTPEEPGEDDPARSSSSSSSQLSSTSSRGVFGRLFQRFGM
ncbi:ExeM/NucH family extracellular endonuclease [Corynebacterium lubricantis]|uniref:ExeM/NucH family extracellular endonuclease n=1 Tax=Corynebacterium lubricantis TaxID=541095 RepID=UPI0003775441|nr:ExeM/NucH family extracellular endonuclease [Corynebacterium lubricantis]